MFIYILTVSSANQNILGYLKSINFPELDLKRIPYILLIAVIGVVLFGGKASFATIHFETQGLIKKIIELREHWRQDQIKSIEQKEAQRNLDKKLTNDKKRSKS